MQTEVKRLEIALMQRIMLREQHVGFLKTAAGPPVMWLPSSVNATLQKLLDHRLSEFTGWKVGADPLLPAFLDMAALLLHQIWGFRGNGHAYVQIHAIKVEAVLGCSRQHSFKANCLHYDTALAINHQNFSCRCHAAVGSASC